MRPLLGLRRAACVITFALGALANAGCAGHEVRVRDSLAALDRGSMDQAVVALNRELGVKSSGELPAVTRDEALLLLDRGSIHLAMGQYERASRDFGAADQAMEVLDLSTSKAADLGRYVFSDDAGPYKAPAYEKLLLNTLNMLSYLARHDLNGARVEARRLVVMQKYIESQGDEGALLGLGSYLAGFTFEKSKQRDEALLHYDEALDYARYKSLRDPLRALTRGEKTTHEAVDALVEGAEPLPPVEETGEAELLVVVGFGRVPQKTPVRIPIGMAMQIVGNELSPMDRREVDSLVLQGAVAWINYPTLGQGRGGYEVPRASIGEEILPLEQALDVEGEVRSAWHKREGTLVLAAITRLLARTAASVAVAGATAAGINAAQDDRQRRDGSAEAVGMLLGFATSLTMSALDTPDTRSWSTLPARIAIARTRVPAGKHAITLEVRGQRRTFDVKVDAGGWALVPFFVLR
ncbi:hypothetical protein [Polyangium sorediatum]|uniref:Tetratricopeptide repeat protein n=1 Tax=Polyangium sorediatum TaxID=889274 RepID=A0ABT6NTL5_9BACT|nr:hypothetical protein [Polyangium sorediatum]MDI1431674.1 hypothetical protein [Polyangium sorediatum]